MTPWTTPDKIAELLGGTVSPDDPNLADCAAAADSWARRKRLEAGYTVTDDDDPGADVRYGTSLYGASLYRERGAADGLSSYEEMSSFAMTGNFGRVRQLLGIGKAQADTPLDPAVSPLRFAVRRHPAAWWPS